MKKNYLVVFALSALILVGAGCLPSYQASPTPAPQTGTPSTTVTNTSSKIDIKVGGNVKAMQLINIENFSFNPAELSVEVGTTVKWTNNDQAPHQISGAGFESQSLGQGESYTFTFDKVGTYNYHCAIHPSMLGKIIVE
jgi:plastocyanin